ncbi:protease inhibitor I42 family protein [Singulisphaera acidiphila]|uniref:Uncharacterized protein n=1 Tax=Singulisphaera acidiphila (strain ATCC BAA-1392 / DSM 18658 / VKM B-2454 / MOB10) TaxID=886293 RepID=L0DI15_SINAD|nr:protease inhibitor I42 family protein [Singulisphaera acidiphila]AGA28448.1 hypothetical protein Sinac_4247 [Singulisphaera acidiphila DSM 18658]
MSRQHGILGALATACLLATSWGIAYGAEHELGRLERIVKSGEYTAASGDLVEISVPSNPSTGPSNPAAKLKVSVHGDHLKKVGVYFAPPAKPLPGAPGEIRAYLTAHGNGTSKVTVTPISGSGQEGTPLEITLKVAKGE